MKFFNFVSFLYWNFVKNYILMFRINYSLILKIVKCFDICNSYFDNTGCVSMLSKKDQNCCQNFKAVCYFMEAKEKEIYTIPRTCSRTPTDLRETKIDNQGIDYQKVDTSAQIEQTDNNSNGDVSKHPFCLFSVATKWDDFTDKSCLGRRTVSSIHFLLHYSQKIYH